MHFIFNFASICILSIQFNTPEISRCNDWTASAAVSGESGRT